jgi:hypothetical protein
MIWLLKRSAIGDAPGVLNPTARRRLSGVCPKSDKN